jgi:hypothetical protein
MTFHLTNKPQDLVCLLLHAKFFFLPWGGLLISSSPTLPGWQHEEVTLVILDLPHLPLSFLGTRGSLIKSNQILIREIAQTGERKKKKGYPIFSPFPPLSLVTGAARRRVCCHFWTCIDVASRRGGPPTTIHCTVGAGVRVEHARTRTPAAAGPGRRWRMGTTPGGRVREPVRRLIPSRCRPVLAARQLMGACLPPPTGRPKARNYRLRSRGAAGPYRTVIMHADAALEESCDVHSHLWALAGRASDR